MPTKQGSLALLNDPVAQEMLNGKYPAHLAYVWRDGTPRVLPIAFHWNGKELVIGTPPDAPKAAVLKTGTKVAVTIDSYDMPYKILYIRGTATVNTEEGILPEYKLATLRMLGEEAGGAWLVQISQLVARMTRIAVTPEWVAVHDFQQRFPSAVERAIEKAMAGAH